MNAPEVRSRGGLLVWLVVAIVVGFEARTAAGMFLGIDIPAVPYVLGLLTVAGLATMALDLVRSTGASEPGR
ncbi:MAG: CbaC protein [Salinirussus sp.]